VIEISHRSKRIKKLFILETILTIIAILLFILVFCRGAFVDEEIAYSSSETQGYTNVKVIDHSWFLVGLQGCSAHDAARFTVKAVNPAGREVEYYICSGWLFKGATLRTK
jgi:hypothetical protein